MTEREKIVLDKIINLLKKYLACERIILFGSRAKGKFSQNADFDLAVDKKRIDIRIERKMKEKIEEIAGLYKYDIVFMDSVDKDFRNIILKTGKIVYERGS